MHTNCVVKKGVTNCVVKKGVTNCVVKKGVTNCVVKKGVTNCVVKKGVMNQKLPVDDLMSYYCRDEVSQIYIKSDVVGEEEMYLIPKVVKKSVPYLKLSFYSLIASLGLVNFGYNNVIENSAYHVSFTLNNISNDPLLTSFILV